MEFKVGDIVRIKNDALETANRVKFATHPNMEEFLGREGEITHVDEQHYEINGWWWKPEMIEPLDPDYEFTVVLHRKGNEVNASRIIRGQTFTASAFCSPEDVFNFPDGAHLAVERLEGKISDHRNPKPTKFSFEEFTNVDGPYTMVVECGDDTEARIFLAYLHGKGLTWINGQALTKDCIYDRVFVCERRGLSIGVCYTTTLWCEPHEIIIPFNIADL